MSEKLQGWIFLDLSWINIREKKEDGYSLTFFQQIAHDTVGLGTNNYFEIIENKSSLVRFKKMGQLFPKNIINEFL